MSIRNYDMEIMSTLYFSHCWAVFEGGGVRAAAHAGAYAAAKKSGIIFGRIAGTSGGSIVAALVAAGAPPDYIREKLQETELSKFQSTADFQESIFTKPTWKHKLLRRLAPCKKLKSFADIVLNSGLYSSRPLQEWLENLLQDLISTHRKPGVSGPVQFSELPLPLHVVATDLTTGTPKIWSRELTPNDSVALAVRCSCTIPFFYQAVSNKQSVFVDGGVISNLPSFVFTKLLNSSEGRNVLSRVLAFRLVGDPENHHTISSLKDFALRLSTAVVDSASDIQLALQPNVYDIVIPTGKIKSTDFETVGENQKRKLYEAGERAVKDFLSKERMLVRTNNFSALFRGFDEKMLLLVQEMLCCNKVFLAISDSTYWLDFAFPTTLSIARQGIQIVCITKKPQSTEQEEKRRLSLLRRLGASIVCLPEEVELPFKGFAFDLETDKARAILSTVDCSNMDTYNNYTDELVRFYTNDNDPAVLKILTKNLGKHWKQEEIQKRNLPYTECSEDELFNLLKTIPQYRNAKFRLTNVEVNDGILTLQEAVKEYKILQIKNHIQDLQTLNCNLFDIQKISLLEGPETIVTPPILERLNSDTLVLIDGNARFFQCLAAGIKSVRAVIVENVSEPLPAENPKALSSLRLTSSTTALAKNYRNVKKSLFRHIEKAVHPYISDHKLDHILN